MKIWLTFDGDLRFIERPRVATALEDSIERAVGPYLRYGDPTARALDRVELADIVRGVAADKWRDEREVREQLAMLDDESARAFFEDAAQRTRRRFFAPPDEVIALARASVEGLSDSDQRLVAGRDNDDDDS